MILLRGLEYLNECGQHFKGDLSWSGQPDSTDSPKLDQNPGHTRIVNVVLGCLDLTMRAAEVRKGEETLS